MQSFAKNLTAIGVASLSLGAGIGLGQGVVFKAVPALGPNAHADPLPLSAPVSTITRSAEELSTIRVTKSVAPAVVTIVEGGGLGSGVIIDGKNGIILTNNHVVAEAIARSEGRVQVKLPNAKTLEGRVLGTDPTVDIAVVKVSTNGTELPQAVLGDSDRLEIGQSAVAIGNPLGLGQTVTQGVVSALNRKIDPDNVEGYIQTDAAISPGNSGGPLLNSQGQVIGINTAVVRGPAEGLGFAVPINVARDVASKVLSGKPMRRAVMGVLGPTSVTFNPRMKERLGLPADGGVLIQDVDPNGPAARAGLRPGDVLTALNGQPLTGSGDLYHELRSKKPGDTITVKGIHRGGGGFTATLRLAETAQ